MERRNFIVLKNHPGIQKIFFSSTPGVSITNFAVGGVFDINHIYVPLNVLRGETLTKKLPKNTTQSGKGPEIESKESVPKEKELKKAFQNPIKVTSVELEALKVPSQSGGGKSTVKKKTKTGAIQKKVSQQRKSVKKPSSHRFLIN